jgi:hypothetical protein
MTRNYFVDTVKKVVHQQTVKDMVDNLIDAPEHLLKYKEFYASLSEDNKSLLRELLNEASEMTLFGMLCVIDGVRAIENSPDKGTLELWYRNGEENYLINDIEEEFLHDLI